MLTPNYRCCKRTSCKKSIIRSAVSGSVPVFRGYFFSCLKKALLKLIRWVNIWCSRKICNMAGCRIALQKEVKVFIQSHSLLI